MSKLNNHEAIRNNPCHKEHLMSFECLNKNNYNRDKCGDYFDNYNTCKKFWDKIYKDRKARGIYPLLPDVEEREQIVASMKDSTKSNVQK